MAASCGLRAKFLALLQEAGDAGLTKPELCAALNIEPHSAQTLADKLVTAGRAYRLHDFGELPRWGINPAARKVRPGPSEAARKFAIHIGVVARPALAPVRTYTRKDGVKVTVSKAPSYDVRFCVDPKKRIDGGFRSAGVGMDVITGKEWQ